MNALFVGGPLDGRFFDHNQINSVATVVPVMGASGGRQFVLMPTPSECDAILAGNLTKQNVQGPLETYERAFLPGGGVEYRFSPPGAFDQALSSQGQPMSEDIPHGVKLGNELTDRMNRFLDRAQIQIVPPGTLGAGMAVSQKVDQGFEYDPVTEKLVITGVVKLTVYRPKDPNNPFAEVS